MSKHTPGPWIWDDDGATLRGPRNMKVLQDGEGLWNLWNSTTLKDGMGEANARLIAIAPMMYDYIASSASNGCVEAKKIIAKAEGEL